MDRTAPFRILSDAEFKSLPPSDRARYLARAVEAHKVLAAQIASGAHPERADRPIPFEPRKIAALGG